jgi:hypothetical protein
MRVAAGRRLNAGISAYAEAGSALVAVLAVVTAVLLIGSALFIMGVGEGDLVEYTTDSARAFWLAEAGQERAQSWLQELAGEDPPVLPMDAAFDDQRLAGGEYDGTITLQTGGNPWQTEYEVVTTGEVDGTIRQVRSRLRRETFAQFVYFHDQSSDVYHTTGDSLDGPFHANGHIRIDGDPWFGGRVTSSEDNIIIRSGSNPVFEDGYELGVDAIPFPDASEVAASLSSLAASGGLELGRLPGNDGRYEIELGRNGLSGYLSYRSRRRNGSWSPWTDVDLSSINGVVWVEEELEVHGTLDGNVTIGCAEDVHITDDLLYEDAEPYAGPNPGCDDYLGLVSAQDVFVDLTAPNASDCVIHGHVMALWMEFQAERYNQGPPRGNLVVWGGIAQANTGPVGVFNSGVLRHGYSKRYHFDGRLMTQAPPGYPRTDRYTLVAWEDVWPPEL